MADLTQQGQTPPTGAKDRMLGLLDRTSDKVRYAFGAYLIMFLPLIWCCFVVGKSKTACAMNIAILVFGSASGWLVGTIFSPYDKVEGEAFEKYGKAVYAFISGYLLSKLDKLTVRIFDPDFFFSSPGVRFHAIILLTSVLLTMLMTFVLRKYGQESGSGTKGAETRQDTTPKTPTDPGGAVPASIEATTQIPIAKATDHP